MPAAARLWVDAGAGVAGDMLLGALLDAGADLAAVRAAIAAVLGDEVTVTAHQVSRCGLAATKAEVRQAGSASPAHPHRPWREVRELLQGAALDDRVRSMAADVYAGLVRAEGRVHGVQADEVELHEVGAWDSVADIVGVCAALADLGDPELLHSPVALGAGWVTTAHGRMPVPVPAVLELLSEAGRAPAADPGGPATADPGPGPGCGELATPTGVALLTVLGSQVPSFAHAAAGRPLTVVGVGAGSRDPDTHANVVRVVVLGERPEVPAEPSEGHAGLAAGPLEVADLVVLEANIDDLDPRIWPSVLTALLQVGARDAWLTPVLMKKGRPAHTLSVLTDPAIAGTAVDRILELTTTFGVREHRVVRHALARSWRTVTTSHGPVRVKVGHRGGRIVTATPELDDVAALAAATGADLPLVMSAATRAADAAGLLPGHDWDGEPDGPEPRMRGV